MTTDEAIALAGQIRRTSSPSRKPFNKLGGAGADLSTATGELRKSFDVLTKAVDMMHERIDRLAANVEFLQRSFEEHPNVLH